MYTNTYPMPAGFTVDSYSVLDPMDSRISTLSRITGTGAQLPGTGQDAFTQSVFVHKLACRDNPLMRYYPSHSIRHICPPGWYVPCPRQGS
jgi:hypothetical protein